MSNRKIDVIPVLGEHVIQRAKSYEKLQFRTIDSSAAQPFSNFEPLQSGNEVIVRFIMKSMGSIPSTLGGMTNATLSETKQRSLLSFSPMGTQTKKIKLQSYVNQLCFIFDLIVIG